MCEIIVGKMANGKFSKFSAEKNLFDKEANVGVDIWINCPPCHS